MVEETGVGQKGPLKSKNSEKNTAKKRSQRRQSEKKWIVANIPVDEQNFIIGFETNQFLYFFSDFVSRFLETVLECNLVGVEFSKQSICLFLFFGHTSSSVTKADAKQNAPASTLYAVEVQRVGTRCNSAPCSLDRVHNTPGWIVCMIAFSPIPIRAKFERYFISPSTLLTMAWAWNSADSA